MEFNKEVLDWLKKIILKKKDVCRLVVNNTVTLCKCLILSLGVHSQSTEKHF